MAFVETIAAWLKVYDGARFRSEMDRAAASERRVATGAKSMAASLATASRGALGALRNVGAFGKKMATFGKTWTTHVSLPLLGIAAISAHMAMSFDAAMTRVQTQAGGSAREVRVLRDGVLELAKTLPQGPQELAEGLYHIESIGIRGARALRVLKLAAEGAAVGGSNLEATASALGGAWLTNIKGAGDLGHVMGILNATVGAGNMRMEELVQALGTGVLPSAKVAGLGIEDVTAALAVFTDENYQGSSAMAQFATALHFIYAPTRKATEALASIGLSSTKLAEDMRKPRGLLLALTDLHNHLRRLNKVQQAKVLGEILPGGRGRVLLVLLNQLERLDMKYRQIARTAGNFPAAVRRTRETPQYKFKTGVSRLEVAGIRLGAAILPAAIPLFEKIVGLVEKLSNAFQHLSPGERSFVLGIGAIAIIAGPVITAIGWIIQGISALAGAMLFLADNPIFLVIAAIVAIGVGLYEAYKHVRWFRNAVNAVWHAIEAGAVWVVHAVINTWNWIKGAFNAVIRWIAGHWRLLLLIMGGPILFVGVMLIIHFWRQISSAFGWVINFIKQHWVLLAGILTGGLVPTIKFIVDHFGQIKTAIGDAFSGAGHLVSSVFEGIRNIIVAALNWIIDKIDWVIKQYNSVANSIPILGGDLKVPLIEPIGVGGGAAVAGVTPNALANPGILSPFPQPKAPKKKPAKAKTSSLRVPLGRSLAPAGAGGPIESRIYLNSREIARALGRQTADDKARRSG